MRDPRHWHPEPDDPFDEIPDEIWYAQEEPQRDEETEWAGDPDELVRLSEEWPLEACSKYAAEVVLEPEA